MKKDPATAWFPACSAIAVAYAAAGWLAVMLAVPPSYASPLYPSAGIALVGVLLCGWRALPAVWLGSFTVNLGIAMTGGAPLTAATLGLTAAIAVGAMLQAAVGAALVRRFVEPAMTLAEPRELLRFFGAGAALACVISASVAVASMTAAGSIGPHNLFRIWLTWWFGDALGVVIATPVLLAFFGRPGRAWRPRRRTVAVPMLVVTLLASLAIVQARRWDEARARAVFERDVASATSAVRASLERPRMAVEALRSLFAASDQISSEGFHAATLGWAQMPAAPHSFGYSQLMRRDEVPAYEAQLRQAGLPGYRVFDRGPQGERLPLAAPEVAALRFIEPPELVDALGVNAMSLPATREAIARAQASGSPAATAGIRLLQETQDQVGVLVFAAVRGLDGASGAGGARGGVVSVSLRLDEMLSAASRALPAHLHLCLEDVGAPLRVLAGAAECERIARMSLRETQALDFAQRHWALHIGADNTEASALGHQDTWLFAIVSLLAAGTFGTLLLTATGRTQRIETAVHERTAALQHQILERGRTEAALRDSEQRFRNIFNHVPIGVIYTDLDGRIMHTNPRFRELVGFGAEELPQMRAADFTHPDDVAEDNVLTRRLLDGELAVFQRRKRFVRVDGRTLWAQVIVSVLRDAQGHPQRIVGAVEDITERLQLEEARAGRELAEAANRAKTDFLSRMSHELRTPLNAMLGFAQLVELDRQHPLSPSQRDWVGQIQTAGWHLLEMINDTLDLSRIESGMLKLAIEATDVQDLLAGTVSLVQRSAQSRGLAVSSIVAPDAAQIAGDPTRIKQILTNLLTNAVKYNVDGGRIHVESRAAGPGEISITVRDSGLGMSHEQLGALFEPFNRLGRERSSQEGTGIGLVISKRLAELMGGRLEAVSTEGVGSAFTLTLPRAAVRTAAATPATVDEAPEGDYRHRIVHYIEDNETNVIVMEGILAQRQQVKLRVSETGLEGLAAVRAQPPSLILLDMHLPDIDGLQLLRLLKDDPATADVPVVAVSADAVAARIDAALDIGADYYLTKPVNVAKLLGIVDQVLEGRATMFDVM